MQKDASRRLILGLEKVREGVMALEPADLNAHCTARYEHAGAVGELRAFIVGGNPTHLKAARERFARMLVMLSSADRGELAPAVEAVRSAAADLHETERERLAGMWDQLGAIAGADELGQIGKLDVVPAPLAETIPGDEIELIRRVMRRLPAGLERWTWEKPTRNRARLNRCWHVDHEVHVQNLLWLALAPALPELRFEETLPSIGRKQSRVDLALPRLQLAIEVKFIRGTRDFARIVDEIAADSNLYTAAEGSTYSRVMVLVWDDTRSSERHAQLSRGLRSFRGVVDAVVVSRPGRMEQYD